MKRMFLFATMFVLLSAIALAGNGNGPNFDVPPGLVKAQLSVQGSQNEVALQQLEQNMAKFMERHQERVQQCNNENCAVEVEQEGNQTTLRTRERVRFLFFAGDAKEEFQFDENGDISNQEANFWRWMQKRGLAD